ncbi:hypothetical protein [Dyadobacter pollutisoli]|uniref:Uncharacterized protein n=1 Tax=Dyadobacter pollutisoli TaxID=2910158 RepID=A0A9E8NE07_9BACT|nr:hypothetical protein [Dyadobacter pollutisoli]WAC13252.1 hypothetical protein ON006_04665 [Dyadobacter pollutisoli]
MFYRFKPTRRRAPIAQPAANANLAKLIFEKITASQRRIAQALEKGCSQLSDRALKRCWLAAGIGSALMASYLMYAGLANSPYSLFLISPASVTPPEQMQVPAGMTQQLLLDLYLDSMQKAIVADSISALTPQHEKHGKSAQ